MKQALLILILSTSVLAQAAVSNASSSLVGTWSGNWTPEKGNIDAITIEIKSDVNGRLSGNFLTPAAMTFTQASYDAKTATLSVAASDAKSGKHYKIDGKVQGNEFKGTLAIDQMAGELILTKWTYFPH
jgi:hypothetical protein